jgi:hypothetical protein
MTALSMSTLRRARSATGARVPSGGIPHLPDQRGWPASPAIAVTSLLAGMATFRPLDKHATRTCSRKKIAGGHLVLEGCCSVQSSEGAQYKIYLPCEGSPHQNYGYRQLRAPASVGSPAGHEPALLRDVTDPAHARYVRHSHNRTISQARFSVTNGILRFYLGES